MKWIDVKERLPEKGEDVLCMVESYDGTKNAEIRWRTIYDNVVVDDSGFAIYPSEVRVLAWMPIPEYVPNKE